MKLLEISQGSLAKSVVEQMMTKSNILQYAEFYSIIGNADYTRKAASATGGEFRDLNADYPDNQVNPAFANPQLKIFGDKVQVDRAHERRGADVASVRAMELLNFARNLGKNFQNKFVNGDSTVDAKEFDGLKNIIPSSQLLTPATDGIAVPLGNDTTAKTAQQTFLEWLDNLIVAVEGGAQLLLMDGKTISRLTRIAEGQVLWGKNEFGEPLAFYNTIPILPAGFDSQGNRIIGHSETIGVNTDATSIYAVRFGEASDLSFATNVGVEVADLGLVGAHYTHSVDFDIDLVLLNDKAVARLQGIRITN